MVWKTMKNDRWGEKEEVVGYFIVLFRDSSAEKTTNNFIIDLGRGRRTILGVRARGIQN
jgi:hypothetical protein